MQKEGRVRFYEMYISMVETFHYRVCLTNSPTSFKLIIIWLLLIDVKRLFGHWGVNVYCRGFEYLGFEGLGYNVSRGKGLGVSVVGVVMLGSASSPAAVT